MKEVVSVQELQMTYPLSAKQKKKIKKTKKTYRKEQQQQQKNLSVHV